MRNVAYQRAAICMRFAAPLVTAFSLINTAVTSVGTLTISGLNFGGTSYTATISITAADACTSTAWTSSTLVACATSGRAQPTVQASVSVSGLVGTSISQFSFDGKACIVGTIPRCMGATRVVMAHCPLPSLSLSCTVVPILCCGRASCRS